MASFWYHSALTYILQREATQAIDLDGDSGVVKIALVDTGYTPNKDDDFMDDPVMGTNEIVATNYTGGYNGAGRLALTGRAINRDTSNDRAVFDSTLDPSWATLGGATNDTISTAVIFKQITSDALSPLICQLDISADVTTNGGTFTIQFADGSTLGIGYIGV